MLSPYLLAILQVVLMECDFFVDVLFLFILLL